MLFPKILRWSLPFLLGVALGAACGDDDDDDGFVGQSCAVPADCYPGIAPAEIAGEIQCLDRVPDGYCTHNCESDLDCCAVDGECDPGRPQVCGPFESTGMMMCFLSCEKEDIGDLDADDFCRTFIHPDFGCRSTGGGSANRKVCVP